LAVKSKPTKAANVKTHIDFSEFSWDTHCNEIARMIMNMYAGDKADKVDKKDPRQFTTIS
jgi:hypothetical protein